MDSLFFCYNMLFHFYNNEKYQSDLYFPLQLQLLNRFQHINQHYLHMYQLNFQLMHPPNQPTCQLTYQTIQIVRPTMQKMKFAPTRDKIAEAIVSVRRFLFLNNTTAIKPFAVIPKRAISNWIARPKALAGGSV